MSKIGRRKISRSTIIKTGLYLASTTLIIIGALTAFLAAILVSYILTGIIIFNSVSVLLILALVSYLLLSPFVITQIERSSQNLKSKDSRHPVSFLDNLKISLTFLVIFSIVIGGLNIFVRYLSLFPETITSELALEISKTIIQSNGFLIGLGGVIFGQMFWAVNHQQNTIQMEILRESNVGEKNIQRQCIRILDKRRQTMTILMLIVIIFFISSICLSLNAMAKTDLSGDSYTQSDIGNPVLTMVLGIVVLIYFIGTSSPSLDEEVEKAVRTHNSTTSTYIR